MQDLSISVVQCTQFWEDKKANLEHILQLIDGKAIGDIVLLPEMFSTGFSMNAPALAEDWNDSPTLNWLKQTAQQKFCAIYTSFMVQDEGKYFNRGVFVEENGGVHYYDKRRVFGLAGEDRVYTPGQEGKIIDYKGWKINLQICYDLRFPEIVRNQLIEDKPAYDMILYVANWPEKRRQHWKSLLRARAIENQCFVAGCNRVGTDGLGIVYTGDSRIIDLLGDEVKAGEGVEEILHYTCSMDHLQKWRKQLPFLKDA